MYINLQLLMTMYICIEVYIINPSHLDYHSCENSYDFKYHLQNPVTALMLTYNYWDDADQKS